MPRPYNRFIELREDLLGSTGRQLRLARLLGRREPPRFMHHRLLRHPDGTKLSKAGGDTGVREMREAGRTVGELMAMVMDAIR